MRTWNVVLIVGLFVGVAGNPVLAAEEGKNIIRFGAQYVMPNGEYKDPSGATVSAKDAGGIAFEYERKLSGLVGLDFGLAFSQHDIEVKAGGASVTIADTTMSPLSIAANFHVLKDKKVDLYLGPQIAYVSYGDLTLKSSFGSGSEKLKADFGYGAIIGLDIPFGSGKWALSTQLRYLVTSAEEDVPGGVTIDMNPFAIQLAARVKF